MTWLSFSWSSVFSWVPWAELSQRKSAKSAAVWVFREPDVRLLKAGIWQIDEYTEIGGRNWCLVEEGAAGAWGKAALLISRGPVCFRTKLPVFAEQPCCHCSFQSLVPRSPNLAQGLRNVALHLFIRKALPASDLQIYCAGWSCWNCRGPVKVCWNKNYIMKEQTQRWDILSSS